MMIQLPSTAQLLGQDQQTAPVDPGAVAVTNFRSYFLLNSCLNMAGRWWCGLVGPTSVCVETSKVSVTSVCVYLLIYTSSVYVSMLATSVCVCAGRLEALTAPHINVSREHSLRQNPASRHAFLS
jgi:hypothetical protein